MLQRVKRRNLLTRYGAPAWRRAVVAANSEMVLAYWEVGRRIHEAVGGRTECGKRLVEHLSKRLTAEFGKGFTVVNPKNMRQFYCVYEKRYALRSELSWTHYCILMRIDDHVRLKHHVLIDLKKGKLDPCDVGQEA